VIPEAKHAARWMARLLPRKVRTSSLYSGIRRVAVSDFTYHQDGLATVHNVDFIKDARFAHAYAKARTSVVGLPKRGGRWKVILSSAASIAVV
jgi:hypothetical protein